MIHKSLNPEWSPPFKFIFKVPSSSIAQMRLVLDVHDKDIFTKDDYLGTTKLDLKDVEITLGMAEAFHTLSLSDIKNGEKISSATVTIGVQVKTMEEYEAELHDTIYEYERWTPTGGWGSDYPGHLLPTDPGRWSSEDGSKWGMEMAEVEPPIPEGMVSSDHWQNEGGWVYGQDFRQKEWTATKITVSFARRREWGRRCHKKLGS